MRRKLFNLNYNFECDWFLELPDNNLASELVKNRSFHNRGNCNFFIRWKMVDTQICLLSLKQRDAITYKEL